MKKLDSKIVELLLDYIKENRLEYKRKFYRTPKSINRIKKIKRLNNEI